MPNKVAKKAAKKAASKVAKKAAKQKTASARLQSAPRVFFQLRSVKTLALIGAEHASYEAAEKALLEPTLKGRFEIVKVHHQS